MNEIVIDASIAVKWLCREVLTDGARDLLKAPESLVAPDWILVEAASSFWKKVKKSELLEVHASRHLETLPRFFTTLYPAADLVEEAFGLAFRLRHPVYDCLYLALAMREGSRLVTADERFFAAIEGKAAYEKAELLQAAV